MGQLNMRRLLFEGQQDGKRFFLVMTLVSGVANAALVGVINNAAETLRQGGDVSLQLMTVYALVLALFLLTNRATLLYANRLVQSRIEAFRRRLVKKISRADLRVIEQLGEGEVHVTVSQETDHLSQSIPLIIGAAQSGFLLLFLLLYIATLSLVSFVLVSGFTAAALYFFVARQKALATALVDVHHREADMLDTLGHFTKGFQEIRLNAAKNDALFDHFGAVAKRLEATLLGLGNRWVALIQFSNAFIFLLVGAVVFVLPIFFAGYTDTIYKITGATVFALGPFAAITAVVRLIGRAEAGLSHLYGLEAHLEQNARPARPANATGQSDAAFTGFSEISLDQATFDYVNDAGEVMFAAGPLDLTLHKGEILFLTGGNGSGKSTALKLLSGLYRVTGGALRCDGTAVKDTDLLAFSALFSAIFTDFHLFDRLYGFDDIPPQRVTDLIKRMKLQDKVGFENGSFTTRDLSTGQRKRLALIVALLEDSPIFVFDEWAADQDANFRYLFYTEILPDLKSRGKTIIAVTHDDQYWHCCDRRVTLDLGMVLPNGAQNGAV